VWELFEGEKTAIFWLGLVVLGYSIYQFCLGGFQTLADVYLLQGMSSSISLITLVPPMSGGVIFLVIGLYIMRAGVVKKSNPPTQE
jgi:hypothetical protein